MYFIVVAVYPLIFLFKFFKFDFYEIEMLPEVLKKKKLMQDETIVIQCYFVQK